MKLSLCLLALVTFTFMATAPGVEGGWRRRRLWRAVKTYAVISAVGKRDVECAGELTDQEAAEMAAELEAKCSALPEDLSQVGLTRSALNELMDHSDANNDNALTDAELDQFAKEIEIYDDCADLASK